VHSVPQVSQTDLESLGMKLDENLSWNAYINDLIKKDCFWYWCFETCSIFCSCYNVEACLQRSSSAPFQLLLFYLTFSSYDTNADLLFEKLNWKTLSFQRKFQKAVMVYKSLNV
jgi:hypothetical protein